MLTEIYIEALLVDWVLADQVWEAWDSSQADDQTAYIAWMLITCSRYRSGPYHTDQHQCLPQTTGHPLV